MSTLDRYKAQPVDLGSKDKRDHYLKASKSTATLKAYKADLQHFQRWGGAMPSTEEQVADYLVAHADSLSVATLTRRLAALSVLHQIKGDANPTSSELVKGVMKGIKRVHGAAQKKVSPITKDRLERMVKTCDGGPMGIRDRALLLVGFASALRRSELVAVNCMDLEFVAEGVILSIKRSKTDQTGEGRKIGIPYACSRLCPVSALKAYMDQFELSMGPLYRSMGEEGLGVSRLSSHGVAHIIKARAKKAGMDPAKFSGHSLRSGLATSAAQAGCESWAIMKQTGHKSDATLRKYIRDGDIFRNNVVGRVL